MKTFPIVICSADRLIPDLACASGQKESGVCSLQLRGAELHAEIEMMRNIYARSASPDQ